MLEHGSSKLSTTIMTETPLSFWDAKTIYKMQYNINRFWISQTNRNLCIFLQVPKQVMGSILLSTVLLKWFPWKKYNKCKKTMKIKKILVIIEKGQPWTINQYKERVNVGDKLLFQNLFCFVIDFLLYVNNIKKATDIINEITVRTLVLHRQETDITHYRRDFLFSFERKILTMQKGINLNQKHARSMFIAIFDFD